MNYLEHGSRLLDGVLVVALVDGGVADVAGHEGVGPLGHVTGDSQRPHVQLLQEVLHPRQTQFLPVPIVLWDQQGRRKSSDILYNYIDNLS